MITEKLHIGTNFGHSAASCLLNDAGEILFAIEEERLNREKHTSKFPEMGLAMILKMVEENNICWSEGWKLIDRFLGKGLLHTIKFNSDKAYIDHRLKKEWVRLNLGLRKYRTYGKFQFIGHHLSHAYSMLPSGIKNNTLIVVSDTIGEYDSISIYYWNGEMKLINSIKYPHSPGSLFHQFAYHLGFTGRTAPGKLMALSGYGEPIWTNELNQFSKIEDGKLIIDLNKYPIYRLKDAPLKFLYSLSNSAFKEEFRACYNNYEIGKNIAASIQNWFTITTWELIKQNVGHVRNHLKLPVNHIALTGGAALNCVANRYFNENLSKLDLDSLYISPWSEDAGTAIGAAVASAIRKNKNWQPVKANAFLGPSATIYRKNSDQLSIDVEKAAKAILEGECVALVSGRLEFGPRALGGRCILANAFDKNSIDKINIIKNRPAFMPVAPAILNEDFEKVFLGKGSENMAWTVKVKCEKISQVSGAIHINGEARVQVVSDPETILFQILKKIKSIRGIGITLLTSLNGADEPMPITLDSARDICTRLGIDNILSDVGFERLFVKSDLKLDNNLRVSGFQRFS